MEGVVLKRTLTEKSILWFGKYNGHSVESLLNSDRQYLKWVYYNIEGVGFVNDVLEKLCIHEDFRIEKPGRDPDMYEKLLEHDMKLWHNRAIAKGDKTDIAKYNLSVKNQQQRRTLLRMQKRRAEGNKGAMAWKNQGH